jgi:hypothetical protein
MRDNRCEDLSESNPQCVLGEVVVAVSPKILKEMCAGKNIFVLE